MVVILHRMLSPEPCQWDYAFACDSELISIRLGAVHLSYRCSGGTCCCCCSRLSHKNAYWNWYIFYPTFKTMEGHILAPRHTTRIWSIYAYVLFHGTRCRLNISTVYLFSQSSHYSFQIHTKPPLPLQPLTWPTSSILDTSVHSASIFAYLSLPGCHRRWNYYLARYLWLRLRSH